MFLDIFSLLCLFVSVIDFWICLLVKLFNIIMLVLVFKVSFSLFIDFILILIGVFGIIVLVCWMVGWIFL